MVPEERKKYFRGILCFPCNSILRVRITVEWLEKAINYLKIFEARGLTAGQ